MHPAVCAFAARLIHDRAMLKAPASSNAARGGAPHQRGHGRTMRHVVEAPDTYPKMVRKHGLHLRHARVHDTGNRDPASR